MPKAGHKTTASAKTRNGDDAKLVRLASELAEMHAKRSAAISDVFRLEEAMMEADRRAEALFQQMDDLYSRIVGLAPATPEGQRALAQAVLIKLEHSSALDEPGDLERGTHALLTAIVGPLDICA